MLARKKLSAAASAAIPAQVGPENAIGRPATLYANVAVEVSSVECSVFRQHSSLLRTALLRFRQLNTRTSGTACFTGESRKSSDKTSLSNIQHAALAYSLRHGRCAWGSWSKGRSGRSLAPDSRKLQAHLFTDDFVETSSSGIAFRFQKCSAIE